MIREDVRLGEGVVIYQPQLVNLYGCVLGAGTKVGAFVEIRRQVVIGRNVKVQAFVFIPEGVTVEDGVFIGPHVCFTNDLFPRAASETGELLGALDWEVVPTRVKEGASIGANATILCGVTVGRQALVGAGAVVTRDVPDHAIVAGNPARVIGDVRDRRTGARCRPTEDSAAR
jgi:acetyltransferase-like isoleucine patch superfamily enzyme